MYLRHGLETARSVVHRLFDSLLQAAPLLGAGLDWKTSLQELTAAADLGVPEYRIAEEGPDHSKLFTATAVVGGRSLGSGDGRTKKEAEQKAAQLAWRTLTAEAASGNGAPPDRSVPELPEVEVVRRGLADHVVDRTIARVEVAHPRAVRRHLEGGDDFAARLTGRTITAARRRGKYLWLELGVTDPATTRPPRTPCEAAAPRRIRRSATYPFTRRCSRTSG